MVVHQINLLRSERKKSPLNYVLVERTKEGLLLISAGYRKYKTYEWICILTQLNAKAHGSFGKVSKGEKSTDTKDVSMRIRN